MRLKQFDGSQYRSWRIISRCTNKCTNRLRNFRWWRWTTTTQNAKFTRLYDSTNEAYLVCLLADAENISFEEAVRAWNTHIDTYLKENGYKQCPHEHALYTMKSGGNVILVALYVDDLIFSGNNDEMIEEFKNTMIREFEMTDLGLLKFFLGLEVKQGETSIFISQEKYAK